MPAPEIAGLRRAYMKNGRRYDVLDLERIAVESGEFVTIVGPSGCGKSTQLHVLDGFIGADAGEIRVHDRVVSGPGPDRRMVFQEFALFPWRTVEGMSAGRWKSRAAPPKNSPEDISALNALKISTGLSSQPSIYCNSSVADDRVLCGVSDPRNGRRLAIR
jgi:ABC-type nitrate/sulfonate/bicarbonate transport system ATPase subunit